ncbi:MAG TPA: hypothetical protein VF647_23070 [Longimicrobium sp.]
MTAARRPVSAARRAALLLAALLHLTGVAAGPVLHAWAGGATAAASTIEARRDDAPGVAHDEYSCVLCQVARSHGLPAAAHDSGVSVLERAPLVSLPAPALPASPLSRARARAPPATFV